MTTELIFDIETVKIPPGPAATPDTVHRIVTMDVATEEVCRYWDHAAIEPDYDTLAGIADDELVRSQRTGDLTKGLLKLDTADILIGHNISMFDICVLEDVLDWRCKALPYDTMAASRQQYFATMSKLGAQLRNKHGRGSDAKKEEVLPKRLLRSHSLESWGYRLREKKDSFGKSTGSFDHLTPKLLLYCEQDVRVNARLYWWLTHKPSFEGGPITPKEAMIWESMFYYLMRRQELNGVGLDTDKAKNLLRILEPRESELRARLVAQVEPWQAPDGKLVQCMKTVKSPATRRVPNPDYDPAKKGTRKTMIVDGLQPGERGYKNRVEGDWYQKLKTVEFNPGSGTHVAHVLMTKYGWKPNPDELTDQHRWIAGKTQLQPITKSEILEDLDYPIMKDLLNYKTAARLIGTIEGGKEAWFNHVTEAGVLHGRVNPGGARTGRCSHSKPNMNVPKVAEELETDETFNRKYGREMRACFRPTRHAEGWVQVGADGSGIQMRCLGHRLGFYDQGAFAEEVLNGDVHTVVKEAVGLYYRNNSKTVRYALLFGAGDKKIGVTVLRDWRQGFEAGLTDDEPAGSSVQASLGKDAREAILSDDPALAEFTKACSEAAKIRGYVRLLDGRLVFCKTGYGAVNDVLQGDESVIMKRAHVLFYKNALTRGFVLGEDFAMMLFLHDEGQNECRPEIADALGRLYVDAITEAGESLGMRIRLDGEYKVGANWEQTH